MITKFQCPTCLKDTEVISVSKMPTGSIVRKFKCGHTDFNLKPKTSEDKLPLSNLLGHKTFPYQNEGILFVEKANFRVLLAHEMGLGKTIMGICPLILNPEKTLPAIVICKSIAKENISREFTNWSNGEIISQVIHTSNDIWFDEPFQVHICSYDMIRMFLTKKKRDAADYYSIRLSEEQHEELREDVKRVFDKAQTIIIDECHYIKNDTSQRTVAVKTLCKNKKNIIALSGTPIKNNAAEYFPILNILRPDKFQVRASFLNRYCDVYNTQYGAKVGGLRNPEMFKAETSDFIIRREMSEVLPDLPEVRRMTSYVDLDEQIQKVYDKKWKEFTIYFESLNGSKSFGDYSNILEYLNELRHLTGVSKVPAAVEYVEDFLTSTDRKLTLFVHHHRVADKLKEKIDELISTINSELGSNYGKALTLLAKDISNVEQIVEQFKQTNNRILIASTLAAGESINLQFCSDCLLVERQWNPANEEQAAVGRFKRIGQKNNIGLNYLLAVATIDDYFTELVEQKRQIFEEVMSGKRSSTDWSEQSIVMELAQTLAMKGKQKFRL